METYTETSPQELLKLQVAFESSIWLEAKFRDERANGNSADAKRDRLVAMGRIDALLDQMIELNLVEDGE